MTRNLLGICSGFARNLLGVCSEIARKFAQAKLSNLFAGQHILRRLILRGEVIDKSIGASQRNFRFAGAKIKPI